MTDERHLVNLNVTSIDTGGGSGDTQVHSVYTEDINGYENDGEIPMNNTTPRKPEKNTRFDNGYRYSDAYIQKVTNWLVAMIFIGPAAGFVVGIIGSSIYGDEFPLWLTVLAIGCAAGGIAIPLLAGAWLGGMAIHRFGGWAGVILILGLAGVITGQTAGATLWFWLGIGLTVIGVALFFYLGFQAKVPMWLQLPILNSPRVNITKGKKKPTTKTK